MSQSVARSGRPSRYSAQVADAICEKLGGGQSLRQICRDPAMPDWRTVFRWLEINETFRQQYARARELQAHAFVDESLEISDDTAADFVRGEDGDERVDHEHIQRSRLRVDTRKWVAGKLLPKVYGDKLLHTGADGEGPIEHKLALDYSLLAAEDLVALRRIIAAATRREERPAIEGEAEEVGDE